MMYSAIALIATLGQLVVIATGWGLGVSAVFYTAALYGAPPYLIMHILTPQSAWTDANPLYLMLCAYHILKYGIFIRARLVEGGNLLLTLAIMLEAAYLVFAGWLMN